MINLCNDFKEPVTNEVKENYSYNPYPLSHIPNLSQELYTIDASRLIIGPNYYIIQPTQAEIYEFSKTCRYHSVKRKCICCNVEFDYDRRTRKSCGLCSFLIKCANCDSYKHIKLSTSISSSIIEEIRSCCPTLQPMNLILHKECKFIEKCRICNENKSEFNHFCMGCYEKIPSTFDKRKELESCKKTNKERSDESCKITESNGTTTNCNNNTNSPIYLLTCEIHGRFLAKASRANQCPLCIKEIRTMICNCCNKEFYYTGRLDNINEETAICDDCYKVLPKVDGFKEKESNLINIEEVMTNASQTKVYTLYCSSHNTFYLSNSTNSNCPYCTKEIVENNKLCSLCGNNPKEFRHLCKECFNALPKNLSEDFNISAIRVLECENHGLYIGTSASTICPTCKKNSEISDACRHFNELVEQDGIIFDKSRMVLMFPIGASIGLENGKQGECLEVDSRTRKLYHNFSEKECVVCGRTYKPTSSRQKQCNRCNIVFICETCGGYFIRRRDQNNGRFCSHSCSITKQHRNGIYNRHLSELSLETTNTIENLQVLDTLEMNSASKSPHNLLSQLEQITDLTNLTSGVWCKINPITKEILDVCCTSNIREEISYHYSSIKYPTNYKYKELAKIEKELCLKGETIQFYLVKECNYQEGLIIELLFALEAKAKYWKPSPGFQAKIINDLKKLSNDCKIVNLYKVRKMISEYIKGS